MFAAYRAEITRRKAAEEDAAAARRERAAADTAPAEAQSSSAADEQQISWSAMLRISTQLDVEMAQRRAAEERAKIASAEKYSAVSTLQARCAELQSQLEEAHEAYHKLPRKYQALLAENCTLRAAPTAAQARDERRVIDLLRELDSVLKELDSLCLSLIELELKSKLARVSS